MKTKTIFLVLIVLSMVVVAGCQQAAPAQTEDTSGVGVPAPADGGNQPERGLDAVNLLSLGTLNLEGTDNAVTPEQAAQLLPLWQMMQSDALQGAAETDAVVKQIQGLMTETQLAAIDAMGLTFDTYQAWMEAQGIEMPTMGQGQDAPGNFQDMSEEERAEMRERMQGMQDLSPEERTTAMAEAGIERPEGAPEGGIGGRGGPGSGALGANPTLVPLIELLTARAAE